MGDKKSDDPLIEIPTSFFDNVFSFDVMRDPVTTPSGHTFERTDIEHWIRIHGTCPVTRASLQVTDLVENRSLRDAIQDFMRERIVARKKLERFRADRKRLAQQLDSTERLH